MKGGQEMSCQSFEELMNAHLDGETSPEEEKLLFSHLQDCLSCAQAMNEFKRVKLLVKTLSRLPAPVSLETRIFDKIGRKITLPLFARVRRVAATAVAGLVLLISSITIFGYFSPEPNATIESNIYLSNHAYHMIQQPLADRTAWSYVAGDSDFELYSAGE